MKSDKIKIGVIGARRGQTFMAGAAREMEFELVAICDSWEDRLKECAKAQNVTAYTDYDRFLEHDMDAVVLANYFHEHVPFAIKAFKAGKHVLSECAACHTMAEGAALAREFEKHNLIYMFAENYPFMAYNQEMQRLYQSGQMGQLPARPTREHWQCSADAIKEVAQYAATLNVQIGLEPVNRYDTFLVNTAEQALELKQMIGEPNVKIHLDTYHMNIEEKSFYDATLLAGNDLMHYHLCENDRGIPGTGLVNWDDIFRALAELNYQGNAALESFVECTGNMNTWVWRQLAPSGDELLKHGVEFIRRKQKEYGLAK